MSASEALLRASLGILAAYHLAMGAASVAAPRFASGAVAKLYGVTLVPEPQIEYVIRMLGLLAIALGALLLVAALDPAGHRPTIVVAAALQASRGICRLLFRDELHRRFALPLWRNAFNAGLLMAQSLLLLALLPGD